MRIYADESILVVIDFQDRLLPHMYNTEAVTEKTVKLIKGMKALELPVITTQQYTKGLGYTDKRISSALGFGDPKELPYIEKMSFSAFDCQEFREALENSGRKNVIICGIEAHVCVLQTAVDLTSAGFNPVLVSDCISSRKEADYLTGMKRWEREGAVITALESILFELCRYSGTAVFKEISALVK